VLTVRLLPRRGKGLRALAAAIAAVESTAVLVVGHTWAGGMLPSFAWIALMASAVFLAGFPVLGGRLRLRVAVPGLVVLQLLLHAWLTVLSPMPDMAGMGAGHDAHLGGLLAPHMLLVHVAGALFTALLWELRAHVVDVVVAWSRPHLPPVPGVRRLARRAALLPLPTATLLTLDAPRRGPPARFAPAHA
jgi:hypothetical protein